MKNKLIVNQKFDLKKKLNNINNTTVKVGFPAISKETNSEDKEGVTALHKATVNNFGLGVPKRPFMNIAFAKNKNEYKRITVHHLKKIEKLDFLVFINKLGLKAQGDIQNTMVSLRTPANHQSTIEAKGSSNPLINTGHTLQSVTYAVVKR